ncbi:hypothetical protein K9M79_04130 [Candidatus Woesearchaeota archaeon]|nr:hypothetical protein [Candidatus Woesearchaeota archaeon]
MNAIMIYIGAGLIFLWGIAHIIPTQKIVKGFGKLKPDSKKILTMLWVGEGLTLIFLGIFAIASIKFGFYFLSHIQIRLVVIMLIILAGLSMMTGARTKALPMKLCPVVKLISATLMFVGSVLAF